MKYLLILVATLSLAVVANAACYCNAAGDPHYLMCAQQGRFDFMDQGLFTAFATDDVVMQVQQSFPLRDSDKKFMGGTTAKDFQYSHVDYCLVKVTRNGCSFIMQTATQADKKSVTINGVKMPIGEMTDYVKKNVDPAMKISVSQVEDKNQWSQSISVSAIKMMSGNDEMEIHCGPEYFAVKAAKVNKCSGLCGDCSGSDKVPTNPASHVVKEVIGGSGGCAATSAPPSSAPPSSAAPSSSPASSAPGSKSPEKPSTIPVPPVVKCNQTIVVQHPAFESEDCLKKVVAACMCGQPKSRMDSDPVFAAFVENCIYDKSLGPGVETLAQGNMWAYLQATAPPAANAGSKPSTSGSSTSSKSHSSSSSRSSSGSSSGSSSASSSGSSSSSSSSVSKSSASTPSPVNNTMQMAYTKSAALNSNFSLNAIMRPDVTMASLAIPAGTGVTYQLKYNKPTYTGKLHPSIAMRKSVYSGAAESATSKKSAITPMPKKAVAKPAPAPAPQVYAPKSPINDNMFKLNFDMEIE